MNYSLPSEFCRHVDSYVTNLRQLDTLIPPYLSWKLFVRPYNGSHDISPPPQPSILSGKNLISKQVTKAVFQTVRRGAFRSNTLVAHFVLPVLPLCQVSKYACNSISCVSRWYPHPSFACHRLWAHQSTWRGRDWPFVGSWYEARLLVVSYSLFLACRKLLICALALKIMEWMMKCRACLIWVQRQCPCHWKKKWDTSRVMTVFHSGIIFSWSARKTY